MAHRVKLTNKKKIEFLEQLTLDANVTRSAKSIGISTNIMYAYRQKDPEFAEKWAAAVEKGDLALIDEARKRALGGSDTLLIFMIKGRHPEFRDRTTFDMPPDSRFELHIDRGPAGQDAKPVGPPTIDVGLPVPIPSGDSSDG